MDHSICLSKRNRACPAPAATALKLSVVVPAFNEEKLIESSLASIQAALQANGRRGLETEIVVCDNNSTDSTLQRARRAGARVVFEPVKQISRARNTGAAAAAGDWLLFVDADSWPSAELIADVLETIDSGRYVGGGSIYRLDSAPRLGEMYCAVLGRLSRLFEVACGSFIFCHADAFRAIEGFSTDLYAMEEIDFSKRLKQYGRGCGKRFTILHRHPLITSGRKFGFYGAGKFAKVLTRCLISPDKMGRDCGNLHVWYDGRR